MGITYLQYPIKFYALLYHVLFVYVFGMSVIGQCLFKKTRLPKYRDNIFDLINYYRELLMGV